MSRIELKDLMAATDGGRTIILDFYPNSSVGFESNGHKKFRIRDKESDPTPSATVKQSDDGVWMICDWGSGDAKSRNAVDLVMEQQALNFTEALRYMAENYCPHLIPTGDTKRNYNQPDIEAAPLPLEAAIVNIRKDIKFTPEELNTLGYKIESKHCHDLSLFPLDNIITRKSEKNGKSWILAANETYPMFYYDYKTWGKTYQPKAAKKDRFGYIGTKPSTVFFCDRQTQEVFKKAMAGESPSGEEESGTNKRLEDLIICSGGSDALNVYAAGYNVAWLNSESEELPYNVYKQIKKWFKSIYVLYDQDNTGYEYANRMAMDHQEIKIINLPKDLCKYKNAKGDVCKDAKDFFLYYRPHAIRYTNIRKYFESLVKTADTLRFWEEKLDDKGNFKGYDINNQDLYRFLGASGFARIDLVSLKSDKSFVHIQNNIVKTISENDLPVYISEYLIDWIYANPWHYNKMLVNCIHRNAQMKKDSLMKLPLRKLDMRSYDRNHDFFFFRNTAVRVTKDGYECIKANQVNKYVLDKKIIDHTFSRINKPLFEVEYSTRYNTVLSNLNTAKANPHTPKETLRALKLQLDVMPNTEKYELTRNDTQFTYQRYVYNTGRFYWRKEEAGAKLTTQEQKEHDLCFISKVAMLGYNLYRFKEEGQAFLSFLTDTEISETGDHKGGTGKSILMKSVRYVRNQAYKDGQDSNMDNDDRVFSGITPGMTEQFFIDDLSSKVDLNRFLNKVTGDMEVKKLYIDAMTLSFEDSPKTAITSNHIIKKFTDSLKRRVWFGAFCDYYHVEDLREGMATRSPLTEFGKNMISEYDQKEMNQFYNFMAQCLHTYLKFRCLIQPPMEAIERRVIQREIGDTFIIWCDEFFDIDTGENLNMLVDREKAFEAYNSKLGRNHQGNMNSTTFKSRVQRYCEYASTSEVKYIFNPTDMLHTATERKRNDIRQSVNGKDIYSFYIRTELTNMAHIPAPLNIEGTSNNNNGLTEENGQPVNQILNADPPF